MYISIQPENVINYTWCIAVSLGQCYPVEDTGWSGWQGKIPSCGCCFIIQVRNEWAQN